jgi:tRNA(Ile)-lysidine synthase
VHSLSAVSSALRSVLGSDPGGAVLIACSGGADSVALLDLLCRLAGKFRLKLGVAHVNYKLRGDDSEEDALFVRELATSYGVPCFVRALTDEESERLGSTGIQEKARRVRYRFFEEVARREGFRYVALGHHRGDQLETFFSNLFRGAGPEGLKGMRLLTNQRFFRPLLKLDRKQILEYLERRCLPFRVDASNAGTEYLRNRLRHELLPVVEEHFGSRATRNILKSMEILAADAELLERLAQREYPAVVRPGAHGGAEVELAALRRLPLALQRRLLRRAIVAATNGHIPPFHLVEKLLALGLSGASGGSLDLGRGTRAVKVYDRLLIGGRPGERDPLDRVELAPGASMDVPEWGVAVRMDEIPVADFVSREPGVFHADRDRVKFPLVLRRAQKGDRFAPLGLSGHHKSLARYFKDIKVPQPERGSALVLADRERLIWIVGRASSEECRVTPVTRTVLRVTVAPLEPPR